MAGGKPECLNEILSLLSEQREMLKFFPYSSEQVREDKRISARIRSLVDEIVCAQESIVIERGYPREGGTTDAHAAESIYPR